MPTIHVYEPALCCNTGLCGPEVSQDLVTFSADLDHLQSRGADITRHNLANDPDAFARNPIVMNYLQAVGTDGLPLVLVDEVTVMTGRYPDRVTLTRLAGMADRPDLGLIAVPKIAADAGSCGSSGCC